MAQTAYRVALMAQCGADGPGQGACMAQMAQVVQGGARWCRWRRMHGADGAVAQMAHAGVAGGTRTKSGHALRPHSNIISPSVSLLDSPIRPIWLLRVAPRWTFCNGL